MRFKRKNGCYVYVVGAFVNNRSVCKIGFATKPQKRLSALQVGSPHPLAIVNTMFFDDAYMAVVVERECHKFFQAAKILGEWFNIRPSIAIEIVAKMAGRQDLKNEVMKMRTYKSIPHKPRVRDHGHAIALSFGV